MRRLAFAMMLPVLLGQNGPSLQPRPGVATSQSTTGSLPTVVPTPPLAPCPTCVPPNYGGQSSTVGGAVNLTGCQRYHVIVCAPSGKTLSGGGTEQVTAWPIGLTAALGVTTWPRNSGLDETHTVSGQQCQIFPGHSADGIGWIQVTPSGVTVSSGSVVTTLIEGSLCGS